MTSLIHAGEPLKKGVGVWTFDGVAKGLKNLGVTWYYNWEAGPTPGVSGDVEFVPMIWDERGVYPKNLETARKSGRILLGFNEPDHKGQAFMTVDEALALWPQLEATGMRLGSPATAGRADMPDGWFAQFMKKAADKGYRIDFICVHNYQENFTDPAAAALGLKKILEKVHELYGKPVWLTEFALANWKTPATPAQQEAYMKEVVPVLEGLPFVERYAWFALPPNPLGDGGALSSTSLCDGKGELNAAGVVYREQRR